MSREEGQSDALKKLLLPDFKAQILLASKREISVKNCYLYLLIIFR